MKHNSQKISSLLFSGKKLAVSNDMRLQKGGYVYIMTNQRKTTLYVGVTSAIETRVGQHKMHLFKNSFTARYNLELLVYYEWHPTITELLQEKKK